jgi:prephenate dehydrogenase
MSDEGPGFFTDKHVAIFGLGLMGGSLAMALKGRCLTLTGIDPDPAAVESARQQAIVDQAAIQPGDLLADTDLIILATPVNTILVILASLPALCAHRAIVLDFGSTKRMICQSMRELPEQFDPIGGHPMCGKESAGLDNADPTLFHGANFALIPLERTTPSARQAAEELVNLIGSHPIWMDAETHDTQVAATSHLPYLAANALAYCTQASAAPMAASGFTSTTRLAVTPVSMMLDVLQTNRDAILTSLHQYCQHLAQLENLISTGDLPALQAVLAAGADNRKRIELSAKGEIL